MELRAQPGKPHIRLFTQTFSSCRLPLVKQVAKRVLSTVAHTRSRRSKKLQPPPEYNMKIGYARVSTEEQHLDLQVAALKARQCDVIFSDHGVSGVRFDRPGLEDALARTERGDTFVVWRLDRLGRSLSHLVGVVSDLSRRGVEFESLTENIDTKSPTGMLIFHMIAALAEFERTLISERTRAGVAAARSRGKKVGRPPALNAVQREQARSLLENSSEAVVAQTFNVHLRTLRRHLEKSPLARGEGHGLEGAEGISRADEL